MHVVLGEIDGRIALTTPVGTLVFEGVAATRLSTAMEEQARWSVAKESGDPDRTRISTFPLYEIIDPAPIPEHGGDAPSDSKGQPAVEPEPVSSGDGITAGSGAGGGG